MTHKFIPKIQLNADISETKLNTLESPMRLDNIYMTEETPKFKDVFVDLVKNVDSSVKAPDQLMESVMTGNGADVHDVMVAMAKAELTVNITTQMTSKVIQAYEKVMSIQL